jgi:hypothetical protein
MMDPLSPAFPSPHQPRPRVPWAPAQSSAESTSAPNSLIALQAGLMPGHSSSDLVACSRTVRVVFMRLRSFRSRPELTILEYNCVTNPKGIVSMGVAENFLMEKECIEVSFTA